MMDGLLALVPAYGLYVVALSTFLSCLALPVPSSVLMIAAGAFVAAGDLPALATAAVALAGAGLGDQAGYFAGRAGGRVLARLSSAGSRPAALFAQAERFAGRWGGLAVFLSRWLVAPLGPYMNFVAGASRLGWARFTGWSLAGEAVWVTVYVGAGFVFAAHLEAAIEILGNLSGALASAAIASGLALWFAAALRADSRRKALSAARPAGQSVATASTGRMPDVQRTGL